MKAQELRIGNWVQDEYDSNLQFQVEKIEKGTDLVKEFDFINGRIHIDILPIPLTEEWFNRFNYTKDENCNYYSNVHGLQIYKKSNGNGYYCEHEYAFLCSLDFVHHLQNLHFDLYNEELK